MKSEILRDKRILLVKSGCPHCRPYLEFIEKINANLPIQKRIKVTDCSKYLNFGIIDDPIIKLVWKHISGFPTLIFDGFILSESNDEIILRNFLECLLYKEFKIPVYNEFYYNKDCKFMPRKIGGGQIVCT